MLNLFTHFFARKPVLSGQEKRRLGAWTKSPPVALSCPLPQLRCVVVDVESSGLNPNRDRLLAIGAVSVLNGTVQLADSFEVVLQQPSASTHDNILVHGISGSTQVGGVPPSEAVLRFLEFLGKAPLVAFHAPFDKIMIERASREFLGAQLKQPWLDLANILPALYPALAHRSLDGWLDQFGITNYDRHNALADAIATAQLLLIAQAQGRSKNMHSFRELMDLEKSRLLFETKH